MRPVPWGWLMVFVVVAAAWAATVERCGPEWPTKPCAFPAEWPHAARNGP